MLVTAGRFVGAMWAKTQDGARRVVEQPRQALSGAK